MMLQEERALRLQEVAQRVLSRTLARLGQADHHLAGPRPKARRIKGAEHRDRLHQGLAGAAGLGNRGKARGLERQKPQDALEGEGVEIVEEVDAWALPRRPAAGTP
jgi:hypothetical protein